jgi:hypothetical protein
MRFFIFLLSCFLCVFLHAQTNVSGNVSGTWTTGNSPYLVTGNIGVPADQTLVIQAGSESRFSRVLSFWSYRPLKRPLGLFQRVN